MTIPSTSRKAGPLLGTGAQTAWPFTFKVFAASDIAVTIADSLGIETALVLDTDYSVTLNANQETSPGGTVTYPISGTPLAVGSKLSIVGDLDYDQPLDLPSGGNFSPLALENQLDRMTMQLQQLEERLSRALLVPITSSASSTLPNPEPNELIGWDSTGDNLANYALSELATGIAYGTMRFDTFVGDGTTTQFALTEDPAALANLDVSFAGVTQVPGTDYTLTSATLVFTTAPANGVAILARYGRALPIVGPTDSSAVTHVAAGAGAVATTVQAKLRESVSVKDFGAVGDGVANDATYFANALTAATGKELVVPPGTYKLNSGLTVPANTVVTGHGATLDFSGAGNIAALTLGSNVTLIGLKIVGPGNASYNGASVGVKCYGTSNSPSAPTYVTGPTLIDIEITLFRNAGVECMFNVVGQITNCKITSCAYAGIQLLSCNRFRVADNYVGQITPGTSGNAYGIAVSSGEGTTTEDPIPVFNQIIGNTVEDVTVWTGIDTHGGDSLIVSNNTVFNCKLGIKITDRDVSGVRTVAPKNIVVSGNYINDNGIYTGAAITVNGAFPSSTTDHATNISVTGNVILGHGTSGSVDEGAIRCYSSRNLVISGNTLRRPKVVGILLDFDNESFAVSGNTIVDPHDASVISRCVYIKTSNNLGSIVGNTFALESSGLATQVAEWAVENGSGFGTTNIVTVAENNLVGVQPNRLQMSATFGLAYSGGDATPSVKNTTYMSITNGGPTTITNFDDSYIGQTITLFFNDSNTTVSRNNAYLSGGVNFTSTANDILVLRQIGGFWMEVCRSVNS